MPRRRISKWHYVYVLQSEKDKDLYIGYTQNLRKRLKEHSVRKNFSTKSRLPFRPIYIEPVLTKKILREEKNILKLLRGIDF